MDKVMWQRQMDFLIGHLILDWTTKINLMVLNKIKSLIIMVFYSNHIKWTILISSSSFDERWTLSFLILIDLYHRVMNFNNLYEATSLNETLNLSNQSVYLGDGSKVIVYLSDPINVPHQSDYQKNL